MSFQKQRTGRLIFLTSLCLDAEARDESLGLFPFSSVFTPQSDFFFLQRRQLWPHRPSHPVQTMGCEEDEKGDLETFKPSPPSFSAFPTQLQPFYPFFVGVRHNFGFPLFLETIFLNICFYIGLSTNNQRKIFALETICYVAFPETFPISSGSSCQLGLEWRRVGMGGG